MSYSRWHNSVWYTFRSIVETNKRIKQMFTICDPLTSFDFSYKELTTDIENCLNKVQKSLCCSDEEKEELKRYMNEFIIEVTEDDELED